MYHSYELETLAVVETLRRFRVYVVEKNVKVVTDCTAVRSTLTKRDLIPRIARWCVGGFKFRNTILVSNIGQVS